MRLFAKSGWGTTSISPPWPLTNTSGMPGTGSGRSTPSRMIRNRPTFSVTSMSPPGRKAIDQGISKPSATVTTR